MPAPWKTRRRWVEPRPVAPEPVTAVAPAEVAWKVRPGEDLAHAYSSEAGWMRSACRRERWTVLLVPAPEAAYRCFECADLVAGNVPEAELRALGGDR